MLELRPYKECDAKDIVSWIKDETTFRKWCADRYENYPITENDINKNYEKSLSAGSFFAMTAVDSDGACGHLIMRFTDEKKRILRFGFVIIDDKKRGMGYGKEMLKLALSYAFDTLKVDRVTLGVFDNNETAYKCYKSAGFKDATSDKAMDFKIMGEDWKCLEMAVDKIVIRTAKPCDAEKILEIYAPYVKNTAITFEYDVPDIEEFTNRIKNTLQRYPYLLAMCGDEILGYAYTEQFKSRAAYDRAVETTIYVKMGAKNQGIGRRLYEELEKISKLQHITNMNACIGYPEIEDEYLTKNSCKFHKHMGYKLVGEFHKCGFKFGRWYNMVWMEKMVGEHTENPDEFIPFSVLDK